MRKIIEILRKRGIVASFYKLKNRIFNTDKQLLGFCDRNGAYEYLLRYRHVLDEPLEVETTANLHPNKIWVLWLQGYDNAPLIVQRCIDSIKEHAGDREVVVLDENNYKNWIEIPDYMQEKLEKKIIPFTQFSDYIRLSLLAKYGGTWIDSTTFLTDKLPEYITEAPLFCFKCLPTAHVHAASWFISTNQPNHPIVCQVKCLWEAYWKKEQKLISYCLIHLFFTMVIEHNAENLTLWKQMPYFDDVNCKVLQNELFVPFDDIRFEQVKRISSVHKLTYKFSEEQSALGDTFYQKIIQK